MMWPRAGLSPHSADYERLPLIEARGFREYDARWLFGSEINLPGLRLVGIALGTLLHRASRDPRIVTGHDFRSYSPAVKEALIAGLMASGCEVHDIGLAVTPMAYFAQFDLDIAAVAMVTASHNDNGWTGIKMGLQRPFTFGPEEMDALRDIVFGGTAELRPGGKLLKPAGVAERYRADLVNGFQLRRKLKVVVACGNGTAGAFVPEVLAAIGCDVIPLHCDLDHSFPNYNPNPEDLKMLHDMAQAVGLHGADLAFGFDGDGDRCGVVDNTGRAIFADKVGVLLARHISRQHLGCWFVADVKSTGLYMTDPVLAANGARTDYWKTGHSYIKRRTSELDAIAGFEKSGHYFFRPPYGRGYDDALVSAIAICRLLDSDASKSLADFYNDLRQTWSSPTMSPHCIDDKKYGIVSHFSKTIADIHAARGQIAGGEIVDVSTVNGVRFTLDDGSWGMVRASSNKPELVVVCESPVSEERMKNIFAGINRLLSVYPDVGQYNQRI